MAACTVEFPVSIGDIVNVKLVSLPMNMLDLDRYQETEYLPARVVSLRKNSNTRYVKLAVKAYWLYEWIDSETGSDAAFYEKCFTFPVYAIGKKVFIEEEGGE